MATVPLAFFFLVSCLSRDVVGTPTGAGSSACDDMTPRHNCGGGACTAAQVPVATYTVTASSLTYAPGQQITVTLAVSGGSPFQGFLLQAREAGALTAANPKLGTFTIPSAASTEAKLMTCGSVSNSVTHSTQNNKNSIAVTWIAPSIPHGDVVFRATFAQSKTVFWVGVSSTVLTPQFPVGDKVSYDEQCMVDKGCFTDCTTPQSACTFQVSYAQHGSERLVFDMKASVTGDQYQYMAVGFSSDDIMANDGVIACVHDSGGPSDVLRAVNEDGEKDTDMLPQADSQLGLSAKSVSVTNGIISCSFITQLAVSGKANIWDLNQKWILFFAQGQAEKDEIEKHKKSPKMSVTLVDLKAVGFTDSKIRSRALMRAHGSLMLVAWVMMVSIGAALARYYKKVWPDTKILSKAVWFQLHRTCMVLAMICTVIAFIIIFVDVDGFTDEESGALAHAILGIIVTGLVIANPIMAMFRCPPDDSKRTIFNWAHWAVGELAWILAITGIFLGLLVDRVTEYISNGTIYVMAVFVVYIVLFFFGMGFWQWHSQKKLNRENFGMKPAGDESTGEDQAPPPPTRKLEMYIFPVHVVVVVALTIALIVLINLDVKI